jgi:hypothetical protein
VAIVAQDEPDVGVRLLIGHAAIEAMRRHESNCRFLGGLTRAELLPVVGVEDSPRWMLEEDRNDQP